MPATDPRIDAYIAKARPSAQPILRRLREVVHQACPDVVEGLKWSSPHFDYKGMFCGFAVFKEHCVFGFWKHALLVDAGLPAAARKALDQFGCLRSMDDLPSDKVLVTIIKAAAKLNDDGVSVPRAKAANKPPVKTPPDMLAAIKKNKKASVAYEAFSPSHKREYVEWVTEAKTDETRVRRLTQAVAWIAEGKGRNWKYERK